ncbi:MAG: F0F1 ATP synthase subunit epsilon [Parachlamydiaceae bacterium]|nr:F0F1 ATP synthase subunit epsilon [Parachlamydiaceae bacterium]
MTFHLFFAIPEQIVFNDEVFSVIIPGTLGSFEALKDHAPILSTLISGTVEILDKNKKSWVWKIPSGYFEMSHNKATLLVDSVDLN